MIAYTYKEHGKFELTDKPKPEIIDSRDAVVHVYRYTFQKITCNIVI